MLINRNTLGHIEEPHFILCKASGERVGVLRCTAKNWVHNYNELDTLKFEIPYLTDAEETEFYDLIDVMKYIEVPEIESKFAIKDVEISNEGQKTEYKSVSCQSLECELGQKYLVDFVINCGTVASIDGVQFYSPGNQGQSLLHLAVIEKCPGWSFGHISDELWTKKRSFEVTRQDVYGFLMNDVAEAFECIFTFDTIHKEINAYTSDEYGEDTNVHVSYNNLLEKADLSYSIDEIKTCVTLSGSDDLSVREINRGYDSIYNFEFWATEEYWSQSLLDAFNAWKALVASPVDLSLFTYKTGVITRAELQGKNYDEAYTVLLAKYQNYYTDISKWTSTLLPYLINRRYIGYGTISYTEDGSDAVTFDRYTSAELVDSLPGTGDADTLYLIKDSNNMYRWNGSWVDVNKWYNCALSALREKLSSAENAQAVAMKAGYGDAESTEERIQKKYVDTYLPAVYQYNAVQKQIDVVNQTITDLQTDQAIIQTDKAVITNKTAMNNNFTADQLKELSAFIREDELSTDNYVVTDVMTEDERFEMLYDFLEYGQKELVKVSQPQLQFSVNMLNLFAIKEFDVYSGKFDLGNYVWVTIRDDYSIKAKILSISLDFLDQSKFTVTFGNVMQKARNIFTDVTDALNTATSAATSVSFGASHWNSAANETDSIGKALADGLLSQKYYLSNAEDNETLINDNGVWITTTTGDHGRENTDDYDAIYLGGGRMLFTDDGWRSVSMSVGRADVSMPHIVDGDITFVTESLFGTFADFLIAGYVGASTIVGGDIYSSNYKTSDDKKTGNAGTHINLNDGTFEFNSQTAGKKRLTLNDDTLEVFGIIQASSGHIGCDDDGEGGFIIESNKMYNGKPTLKSDLAGVYVGTDGISLGTGNTFSVTEAGYLTTIKGEIGGATIESDSIHAGNGKWYINSDGTASFKSITIDTWAKINDVQPNSSFGKMEYKGNSYNIGTFAGGSYYGSSSNTPFSGGCVTHIEQISAEYIYANYLEAMYARIGTLEADNVTIHGTLTAHAARIGTLEVDNVTIKGKLTAHEAEITTIKANYLTADRLASMDITTHGMSTSNLYVSGDHYRKCDIAFVNGSGGTTSMSVLGF